MTRRPPAPRTTGSPKPNRPSAPRTTGQRRYRPTWEAGDVITVLYLRLPDWMKARVQRYGRHHSLSDNAAAVELLRRALDMME